MVAAEVVAQQSRVCMIKMENIEGKLAELTRTIEKLTETVDRMRERSVERDAAMALRDAELDRKFTILDGRWKIYSVLVGVMGAVGLGLALIESIKNLF